MNPNNTGSFGAAIGGVDALKAAMQRRGMDASVLDQVSPAAPGPSSPVAPALPPSAPNVGPTDRQVAQQANTGSQGQPPATPFRSSEMEISLKALKSVVDTENKVARLSLGLR